MDISNIDGTVSDSDDFINSVLDASWTFFDTPSFRFINLFMNCAFYLKSYFSLCSHSQK